MSNSEPAEEFIPSKCDQCGRAIERVCTNANSAWTGNEFCCEACADYAQENDEQYEFFLHQREREVEERELSISS